MNPSDSIRTRSLVVIGTVLVIAALRASYPVTMPVAIAALAIAAAWPVKLWLGRWLPEWLSYLGTIVLLLAVLAAFVAAVYFSVAQIVQAFAENGGRLAHAWRPVESWLAQWGLSFNAVQGHRRLIAFGQSLLGNTYTILVYLGFIVLLVIFGLPQVPASRSKIQAELSARNRHELIEAVDAIAGKIRGYIAVTTATSILTGVVCAAWALATGLDLALVWGALNFLLNYIPIIGNAVGTVLPVLYAAIQFQNWTMPAIVFAGFAVIQIGVSNFLYPFLQGRSMALSPFAVIVALAVWTWIWGIAGALIAIPLTVTLTVICGHFPATRWIAVLLSGKTAHRSD